MPGAEQAVRREPDIRGWEQLCTPMGVGLDTREQAQADGFTSVCSSVTWCVPVQVYAECGCGDTETGICWGPWRAYKL